MPHLLRKTMPMVFLRHNDLLLDYFMMIKDKKS